MGKTNIYCTGILGVIGSWYQIINDDKVNYGLVESDEELSEMSHSRLKKVFVKN